MTIYFAPLEGVTDAVFRRVHHETFTHVRKYFIPFISPAKELSYGSRTCFEISCEANEGVPAVPQVLTNSAELFNPTAQMLADNGFTEVNLNIGCPSGTVTAKGKGSGLLRDLDSLRRLLDGIYANPVLPVSIKTRIGFSSVEEWGRLRSLYRDYPVHELIVHPRTRTQFYSGTPYRALCEPSMVYNGDIFCVRDMEGVDRNTIMLGRGLVANPALARELNGGAQLTRDELLHFYERLLYAYVKTWPLKAVTGHMHEISRYFICCFEAKGSIARAIRKSTNLEEYTDAMARLFETCPMKEIPAFIPPTAPQNE